MPIPVIFSPSPLTLSVYLLIFSLSVHSWHTVSPLTDIHLLLHIPLHVDPVWRQSTWPTVDHKENSTFTQRNVKTNIAKTYRVNIGADTAQWPARFWAKYVQVMSWQSAYGTFEQPITRDFLTSLPVLSPNFLSRCSPSAKATKYLIFTFTCTCTLATSTPDRCLILSTSPES